MEISHHHRGQRPKAIKAAEMWREPGIEPSLDEVFSDPLIQMVMRRDGVSMIDVQKMMPIPPDRLTKVWPSIPALKH